MQIPHTVSVNQPVAIVIAADAAAVDDEDDDCAITCKLSRYQQKSVQRTHVMQAIKFVFDKTSRPQCN